MTLQRKSGDSRSDLGFFDVGSGLPALLPVSRPNESYEPNELHELRKRSESPVGSGGNKVCIPRIPIKKNSRKSIIEINLNF